MGVPEDHHSEITHCASWGVSTLQRGGSPKALGSNRGCLFFCHFHQFYNTLLTQLLPLPFANRWPISVVQVARDPSPLEAFLIAPLVHILHLPAPHHPPKPTLLVRLCLRLEILSEKLLVLRAERARVARQPHATAHTHRPRDRAVVQRSREAPVKALAAIRRCCCPLAYEGPERRGRHNRRVLARAVDVLLERQRVVLPGKGLVKRGMMISAKC